MSQLSSHLPPDLVSPKEPIAIIGIGCRYPGGVNSPESFWQLLCNEVDAITEMPADRNRFDLDLFYDATPATPGKVITRQGGFLEKVDQFDASFFGISPREANCLDPQQRLLLEVAWEAFEDGGLIPAQLASSLTGVFIGMWTNEYEDKMYHLSDDNIDLYITTGGGRYAASGRLSYIFDLRGPSVTVDTACSSSLVAVHLACQSLRNGEATLALAGGVNLILEPQISIGYSRSKMLSPDARCKFGDARANGYVRSEGVGVVILKPLSQALMDQNPIYALIRGSAFNNDGRSSELLVAPGVKTQIQMLREVYRQAGISPGQVGYVEAHGTGTRVGDPVELEALGTVLAEGRSPDQPCLVGSVKTNIGHTEAASGIAGLIKAALCLQHRAIPASLHFQEPNPDIPWTQLPLAIQRKFGAWPEQAGPALAGVNSFGVTGTNAHVILQEPPSLNSKGESIPASRKAQLIPLSAHTPEALKELVQACLTQLTPVVEGRISLLDFAYSAAMKRSHHGYRLTAVAHDQTDLTASLRAFLQDEPRSSMVFGHTETDSASKIVFVFPGQGSQWLGMGRELLSCEPVFRQTLERCEQAMRPFVGWSLLEQLTLDETAPTYRLDEIDVIQPTLLSIEIALAALWRSWGVEPDAVIGHSMGEVAAAYIAGALSLDNAMQVICRRSQLLRRTSGQGAMAVVELSIEEAQAALTGYEDRLSIAVSNSPRSTVLSGDPDALTEVINTLERRDVFCRLIKVDVASHSPQMDPLKADLLAALEGLQPQAAPVSIYSTALGIVTDGANFDPAYWVQNLRRPVLFSEMVQQLLADDHNVFIEMSPHPILLPAVQQGLQSANRTGTTLSSLRRNEGEQAAILASLGALYTLGYPLDWAKLYPSGGTYVKLPLYPWQRERFWFESPVSTRKASSTHPGSHPLLGQHVASASGTHIWENELSLELYPYLGDHRVQGTAVLPAAAYAEMALAAVNEAFGQGWHILEKVVFKEALTLPQDKSQLVQLLLTPDLPSTASCQFFSRPAETPDSTWILLASATIRLHLNEANGSSPAPPEITPVQLQEAVSGAAHYQALHARGLEYGPAFQGVAHLWPHQEGNGVSAELRLAETATAGAYLVHPALLDACFQLLLDTLAAEGEFANSDTYLPVSLERLQFYGQPQLGGPWRGYAARHSQGAELYGDVFLLDEAGQVVMAASGLRFKRLARDPQAAVDDWLYELQWQPQSPPEPKISHPSQASTWLIFTDRSGVGRQLAAQLADLGEKCVLVSPGSDFQQVEPGQYQLNPASPHQFAQLLREVWPQPESLGRGIIHLWGLDSTDAASTTLDALKSAQETGSLSVVHLIQALNADEMDTSPRLWLVTRGAQAVGSPVGSVNVAQAPVWGLGRVIAHEHPELRCVRLDLNPAPQPDESAALFAELWADTPEDQIALRADGRYAARLVRYHPETGNQTAPEVTCFEAAPGQAYRLEMTKPGILDDLILRATTRQEPGPGQVEIEVGAVGLNFIDVMKAMGLYPGLDPNAPVALGAECAGRVISVGAGVSGLQVGDEVIALTPSFDKTSFFSAYVTIPADLVVLKPAHLSFEEAATLPVTFLTAYYAMHYLGRLGQGERVLIHSAAGGVGLAAVQLAQLAQAEIFATAGTPEKRAYLHELGLPHVLDSRSLSFAEEIMAQTGGRGVDMVLNSLAGEAIRHSLAVLGPYGRFLEIGKRDIYQNYQIGLEPFKNSLAYFAIDLARLTAERPTFVMSLLRELMPHFESRALRPLPLKVFPAGDIAEAFRYMAQAKHIGKVVVTFQKQKVLLTGLAGTAISIHPDGTYLITGGLGGLGLTVAKWLVDQGARHLVLMGRSGGSAAAQEVINQLEASGVQVQVAQADVAQTQAVAGVIKEIEQTMPPLRGIIHAAGLLDDSSLLQLNREQFERVTAPKIEGAWNLHTLTQQMPLDFFILFSSVTALLGTPGQGNYAAANAFLDALAHHRHALGQPALSLNWGPWSQVGLAAAQANRGARLAARGIASITPQQGLSALARLFRPDITQVAIMPFNLAQWAEFYPAAGKSPLFSLLQAPQAEIEPKEHKNTIREALLTVDAGRRRQALLEAHIREQAAVVLRLAPNRVPLDKPLKNLGLDSLMTLELRNRLELSLGVTLSATLLWNYPTVAALTPFLADKMAISLLTGGDSLEPPSGGQALDGQESLLSIEADKAAGSLTELDQLSQDEVEAMLAEELAAIDDLLN